MKLFDASKERTGRVDGSGVGGGSDQGHSGCVVLLGVHEDHLRATRASLVHGNQFPSLQFPYLIIHNVDQSEESPCKLALLSHLPFQSHLFYTLPGRKREHSFHPFLFLPWCTASEWENLQKEMKK